MSAWSVYFGWEASIERWYVGDVSLAAFPSLINEVQLLKFVWCLVFEELLSPLNVCGYSATFIPLSALSPHSGGVNRATVGCNRMTKLFANFGCALWRKKWKCNYSLYNIICSRVMFPDLKEGTSECQPQSLAIQMTWNFWSGHCVTQVLPLCPTGNNTLRLTLSDPLISMDLYLVSTISAVWRLHGDDYQSRTCVWPTKWHSFCSRKNTKMGQKKMVSCPQRGRSARCGEAPVVSRLCQTDLNIF